MIAIIALLIGIMLPSLAGARNAGRSAVCMNTLRQLGLASQMYADDNDGAIPRSQHSALTSGRAPWEYALMPYLGQDQMHTELDVFARFASKHYRCPMDDSVHEGHTLSYGQNVYFELTRAESQTRTFSRQDLVPSPSATVLMGELEDVSVTDHVMAHFWVQYSAPPEIAVHRHGSSCGYVFLDGHSRDLRFTETFDAKLEVDRWNPSTAH